MNELTSKDLMRLRVMFGNRQSIARRELRARVLNETTAELPDLSPQEVERYYDELYDADTGNRRRG